MKKVYYISTIIFAVFVVLLFDVLALSALEEKSTAVGALLVSIIAIGCLILSITGLRKDQHVGGIFLEKIGIILIGFALIVLEIGLFSIENILQAIIIVIIAAILGALSFVAGIRLIKRKRTETFSFNLYKEMLFERMPHLSETLNEGVSSKDIREAENIIGIRFPEYLKELYLTNNGDDNEAICGMIMGLHFMSLESMLKEWRELKKIADDPKINNNGSFSSTPMASIKRCYADAKWIPFCTDGGGNFIGIDLAPGPNGKAGQIINFGRDEGNKAVLAKDMNAFFERLIRIIKSDDFYIADYDGEDVILLGTDDIEEGFHLTDYLKSADSVK
ncbi:MAG: SMI1/KNR4 family protein [Lachnospiraceae bacterium]|nr:SMI1/KNR4 family protein [Lachnospiraceae bacterium]